MNSLHCIISGLGQDICLPLMLFDTRWTSGGLVEYLYIFMTARLELRIWESFYTRTLTVLRHS